MIDNGTKGSVFKRGNRYWLKYYVGKRDENGSKERKAIQLSLGTDDKTIAREKAKEMLSPTRMTNEVDRQRLLVDALQTKERAAAQAQAVAAAAEAKREADKNRLPLVKVWERYPYTSTAPNRGTSRQLSPTNVRDLQSQWGKFVAWATGRKVVFLEDLTPELAKAFSRYMIETDGITPQRHNKVITTCSVMCRRAERPDPFADIQRHAVVSEGRVNLEREELDTVIDKATGELRRLFIVGLYTGMRLADCVLLQWSQIRHGRIIRVMAKTRKELSLPVHPALQSELDTIPAVERGEYVCPALAAKYLRDSTSIPKMVRVHFEVACNMPTLEGSHASWAQNGRKLKPTERLGVGPAAAGRKRGISRRGFHSLRHTFISECARAGVPIGMIREWVGHSSELVTRLYEHWEPREAQQRIMAALPDRELQTPAVVNEKRLRERGHKLVDALSVEALETLLAAAAGKTTSAAVKQLRTAASVLAQSGEGLGPTATEPKP